VQRRNADKELQFAAESLARAIGQALAASVRGLTAMANHIGTCGSLDSAIDKVLIASGSSAVLMQGQVP
jgi:hypothetical protein